MIEWWQVANETDIEIFSVKLCESMNNENLKGEKSTMPDNSRAINRVFTRGVINSLIERGSSDVYDYVVSRYVNDYESKTHGQIIREIYHCLGREHRNEYYYMNTLLNRLLCGNKHNVNTTTALSQMRVGRHIADFVLINGEGLVYEIKSDLDNYDRLFSQLSDYYRAFSYVAVLADAEDRYRVERVLASFGDMGVAVGIYDLTERNTINWMNGREPKLFDDYLDHCSIFKILRKREYENVLLHTCGKLPQVAPVFHFRACLEQFKQIPIKKAQDIAVNELRKRNKISKTVFERIQPELRSTVYFAGLSRKIPQLEELLQSNYRG